MTLSTFVFHQVALAPTQVGTAASAALTICRKPGSGKIQRNQIKRRENFDQARVYMIK